MIRIWKGAGVAAFCTKCGARKVEDDSQFCMTCGAPYAEQNIQGTPTPPVMPPGRRVPRWLWAVATAIVVIAGVVLAAVYVPTGGSSGGSSPEITDAVQSGADVQTSSLRVLYPASSSDGKWGYVDETGAWVIQPQFEWTGIFSSTLGMAEQNGKYGYIDDQGNWVIQPQFDSIQAFGSEDLAAAEQYGMWGYIDKTGNWVIQPQFYDAGLFSEGLAFAATSGNAYGYIDATGKWVIRLQFTNAYGFSNGMAAVAQNGKWGYIDTAGNWVIQPQFDCAYSFVEGLAPAGFNGKWGYIDSSGTWTIQPQYDSVREFSDGLAPAEQNGLWGYIDKTGSWIIQPLYEYAAKFADGLAWVYSSSSVNGGYAYIDKAGKVIWTGSALTEGDLTSSASLTASSVHPHDGSNYYYTEYLADDRFETSWSVEGINGWAEFDFSSPVDVTELRIVAGYQKVVGWDRWPVNNRLRSFRVEYSDGSSEVHEVLDQRDWQIVKLKGTWTTSVRIVILSVYPYQTIGPNGWNDTCISEIHVWGSH